MQIMQGCGAASASDSKSADTQTDGQRSSTCGEQKCGQQGCGGGGGSSNTDLPPAAGLAAGTICMKCRKQEAQLVARGREPLCHPCLREQLMSKVRNAVRLHALILPGDRMALAFSGGASSAALLHFLSELRNPRTDRPARGKVSFSLHIIHIDDSAAWGLGAEQAAAARASVAAAAQRYCCEGVQYHCVPLESVFEAETEAMAAAEPVSNVNSGGAGHTSSFAAGAGGLDSFQQPQHQLELNQPPRQHEQQQQHHDELKLNQQRQRLQALLSCVGDTTGREDLLTHLRTRLLLHTAAGLGCARVARGDCATALAIHIVAAASKGCGYSLAGDVRLVDARHGAALPSFFLPLREVSAREISLLCSHWQLPLAEQPPLPAAAAREAERAAKKSINSLAATFIAGMEAHNPGSVPNILNTISKLDAFPWNDPPVPPGSQASGQHKQQQRQLQQQQQGQPQLEVAAVLCPICWAPMADDELPSSSSSSSSSHCGENASSEHTSGGVGTAAAAAAAGCCLSCYSQILGGGAALQNNASPESAAQQVVEALPAGVRQQMAALSAACRQAAAAAGDAADADSGREPQIHYGGTVGVKPLRAMIADCLLE